MEIELTNYLESIDIYDKEKVLEAYNNVIARTSFDGSFFINKTLSEIFYSTLTKPSDLKFMKDEFLLGNSEMPGHILSAITDIEIKEKLYFLGNFGFIISNYLYYEEALSLGSFIHKTLFARIFSSLDTFRINAKFEIMDGTIFIIDNILDNKNFKQSLLLYNKLLQTQIMRNFFYICIPKNVNEIYEICQNVEYEDIVFDPPDTECDDLFGLLHSIGNPESISELSNYTDTLIEANNDECRTLLEGSGMIFETN